MKKRFMVLLMAAIMVGGVLTGCGSEKEVTEPKNEETVVEESATEENTSGRSDIDRWNEEVVNVKENTEVEATDEDVEGFMLNGFNQTTNVKTVGRMLTDLYRENEESIIIFVAKVPKNNDIGVTFDTAFAPYVYDIGTEGTTIGAANINNVTPVVLSEIDFESMVVAPVNGIKEGILYCEDNSCEDTPDYGAEVLTDFPSYELFIPFSNNFSHIEVNGVSYMSFRTYDNTIDAENVYYTLIRDNDNTKDLDVICDTGYTANELECLIDISGYNAHPISKTNVNEMFHSK